MIRRVTSRHGKSRDRRRASRGPGATRTLGTAAAEAQLTVPEAASHDYSLNLGALARSATERRPAGRPVAAPAVPDSESGGLGARLRLALSRLSHGGGGTVTIT